MKFFRKLGGEKNSFGINSDFDVEEDSNNKGRTKSVKDKNKEPKFSFWINWEIENSFKNFYFVNEKENEKYGEIEELKFVNDELGKDELIEIVSTKNNKYFTLVKGVVIAGI